MLFSQSLSDIRYLFWPGSVLQIHSAVGRLLRIDQGLGSLFSCLFFFLTKSLFFLWVTLFCLLSCLFLSFSSLGPGCLWNSSSSPSYALFLYALHFACVCDNADLKRLPVEKVCLYSKVVNLLLASDYCYMDYWHWTPDLVSWLLWLQGSGLSWIWH